MKCLEDLKVKHPSVGDVRYIGLFSALELVVNRESKEIMPASVMADVGKFLRAEWIVYLHHGKQYGQYALCRPAVVYH